MRTQRFCVTLGEIVRNSLFSRSCSPPDFFVVALIACLISDFRLNRATVRYDPPSCRTSDSQHPILPPFLFPLLRPCQCSVPPSFVCPALPTPSTYCQGRTHLCHAALVPLSLQPRLGPGPKGAVVTLASTSRLLQARASHALQGQVDQSTVGRVSYRASPALQAHRASMDLHLAMRAGRGRTGRP